MNMNKLTLLITLLILAAIASAQQARVKAFYKVSHISQSVVGISCPGNDGDPTVITNVSGTLLVSCGR
jgi:hypothetical protein